MKLIEAIFMAVICFIFELYSPVTGKEFMLLVFIYWRIIGGDFK